MPMEFHKSLDEQTGKQWAATPGLMPDDAMEAAQSRIEDYLDRVGAPLIGRVAYSRRKELRDEMHQHLWSLVLAYQELGHDLSSSVDQALEKFGEPEKITRQLETGTRSKGLRGKFKGLLTSRAGTTGSLAALGLSMLLFGFVLRGSIPFTIANGQVASVSRAEANPPSMASIDPRLLHFKHSTVVGENCTACHSPSVGTTLRSRPLDIRTPSPTTGQPVPIR